MNDQIILSQSRIATFLQCRKKYYWKYVEHLHPIEKPIVLKIGDIVHQAIDAYWRGTTINQELIEQMTKEKYPEIEDEEFIDSITPLILGYIESLGKNDSIKMIGSETWIEIPYRKDKNVILQGRIDGVCEMSGKLFRIERKTTSRLDSGSINSMKYSTQEVFYQYLTSQVFGEIRGVLYEFIVKTKMPKFVRLPLLTLPSRINEMTEELIDGMLNDLRSKQFYPSIQCKSFNRVCDYMPLCFEQNVDINSLYMKGGDNNEDVNGKTE